MDELARCGMRRAVTCPGSRNAPIALTLAGDDRLEAVSVIDERAAGFLALGLAKAGGRPVAVTCTSGTAAANLAPAVAEAHEARVPLLVLTADRPPELRDVGAGQAIDQVKLYGTTAKWFVEVGNLDPGRDAAVHYRALACRAFWTAASGRPGPVHLNFPLREPLAPVQEELDPSDWQGRADGRPWTEVLEHCVGPPRLGRPATGGEDGSRAAGGDRVRPDSRADGRSSGAAGRGVRLAGAGRAHLGRPLRRSRPLARRGALRRAARAMPASRIAMRRPSSSGSVTRRRPSRFANGSQARIRS